MEPSAIEYAATLEEWRKRREEGLRGPRGWLSVVALHWLVKEVTTCGSALGNDIVLEGHGVPARTLVLRREGAKVFAEAAPDSTVRTGAGILKHQELRSDATDSADLLFVGSLSLELLERRTRRALRVRDELAPRRAKFPGLRWFPVDPAWSKQARFMHHEPGRTLPIIDVTGDVFDLPNPGRAVFDVADRSVSLEAVQEPRGGQQLFFLFKDTTNKALSYGGGRYLFAAFQGELASLSELTLDFNRAVTPPCGLTPYATCPMPPADNVLNLAVTAGELAPPEH